MALGTPIESPSVKYGAAADLLFGCPESQDFDIVESSSQTSSYGTDVQVKNEVGNTVGQVIGDPKIELTITGFGKTAPMALGAITEFQSELLGVGSNASPQSGTAQFCVKSVKQDNSNEDFVKFEVTAERYLNVNYGSSSDLSTGSAEFG